MKSIFTCVLCFLSIQLCAQAPKEKELKTEIKEVTVFLQGAQIFESGNVVIPAGKTVLKIPKLSPHIDEKSIQVKSHGEFTILSVNHKFNFIDELKKGERVDSLRKVSDAVELSISRESARLLVLGEKLDLLNANKHLGSQTSGPTLGQLKQAIDFYENEISKIKEEEININKRIEAKKGEKSKLEHQLKELNEKTSMPASEIEITLSADQQVNTTISVTYLVANAGWYPKYDVRVENINSPLLLTYKAEVFQNTGVDWKNVKLRFSNANPNQSGLVPDLNPWNLTYAGYTSRQNLIYGMNAASVRNVKGIITDDTGAPLPGVNILVKGTTIGTATDINGNYSLTLPNNATTLVVSFIGYSSREVSISKPEINVQLQPDVTMLSEAVVTGYGIERSLVGSVTGVRVRGAASVNKTKIIPTSIIENQTTVEFEVLTPYSIRSNGEKLLVDLKTYDIPAEYEYYGVPKLEKDAFLIARIINWDQYNLIQGEANLYFEDAYVGRSILNARALEDTLTISLGRDKNIVISRERREQFLKKKFIGSNVIDTRAFMITVRNKKSQPLKLTIFDQIPVSLVSDITVEPVKLGRGEHDSQTGKLKWQLELNPKEQKEVSFEYEVKYPKKEKVLLE